MNRETPESLRMNRTLDEADFFLRRFQKIDPDDLGSELRSGALPVAALITVHFEHGNAPPSENLSPRHSQDGDTKSIA